MGLGNFPGPLLYSSVTIGYDTGWERQWRQSQYQPPGWVSSWQRTWHAGTHAAHAETGLFAYDHGEHSRIK
jgi:hypothetical protein